MDIGAALEQHLVDELRMVVGIVLIAIGVFIIELGAPTL